VHINLLVSLVTVLTTLLSRLLFGKLHVLGGLYRKQQR
jgi:hypothetical protein